MILAKKTINLGRRLAKLFYYSFQVEFVQPKNNKKDTKANVSNKTKKNTKKDDKVPKKEKKPK